MYCNSITTNPLTLWPILLSLNFNKVSFIKLRYYKEISLEYAELQKNHGSNFLIFGNTVCYIRSGI